MKKISDKMTDGLNKQITAEFESAYLYLAMAGYLQAQGFSGMAQWFRAQADEEKRHALKINDFMLKRDLTPDLGDIRHPVTDWKDITGVFDDAYRHECRISHMIYDLVAQGMEDGDFAGLSFLQWFVDEQVEEELTALGWLEKIRFSAGMPAGLMLLDSQMAERSC